MKVLFCATGRARTVIKGQQHNSHPGHTAARSPNEARRRSGAIGRNSRGACVTFCSGPPARARQPKGGHIAERGRLAPSMRMEQAPLQVICLSFAPEIDSFDRRNRRASDAEPKRRRDALPARPEEGDPGSGSRTARVCPVFFARLFLCCSRTAIARVVSEIAKMERVFMSAMPSCFCTYPDSHIHLSSV